MLFDPERHEPLTDEAWDPERARAAVRTIVADLAASFSPTALWPEHPLDEDGPPIAGGYKSIYLGAAGTLWAMGYLAREGAASLPFAPEDHIARVHAAYLDVPDAGAVVPSYYLGEVGILLVQWKLTRAPDVAERLYAAIEANIPNPTNEALWAAPGTMLGALHMLQWTGEARWRELFLANVEQLWRTWSPSERAGCHVWTQDLYGNVMQYTGAGHGFAGNVYPLLRGRALLSAERREQLYARCVEALRVAARHEGDAANWHPEFAPPEARRGKILMQWCHGAPGIVTALNDFPPGQSADMDALLLAAGRATWQAGPLTKGPSLCHGTAGNGYAFLKLYRRTGDPEWLARARAFAMHAIRQSERMRREHGRGRYTLWTGDPGVAVYVWHCLTEKADLPALDSFD
ncbi:Lanthionine synthetase C-like protein [Nannocystis exedens]|uniref:Lanthionine synthetase C-like protein n=1 Tax=Nannocystis exedens TaxID=54 RepID=A0A1I2CS90_9BACT|nr:LanC-like protein [Nannocystis exedens]PCC68499.1 Lanthionine synthetase C-like protein [Nannocystis exedens]SFE70610.1 Lanthionine synthetase C-like protein [Nannocystis exedens]